MSTKRRPKEDVIDWREELTASDPALLSRKLREVYGNLAPEVEKLPRGPKIVFQVLVDPRQLHALRVIRQRAGVSVQVLLRRAVDMVIEANVGERVERLRRERRSREVDESNAP